MREEGFQNYVESRFTFACGAVRNHTVVGADFGRAGQALEMGHPARASRRVRAAMTTRNPLEALLDYSLLVWCSGHLW